MSSLFKQLLIFVPDEPIIIIRLWRLYGLIRSCIRHREQFRHVTSGAEIHAVPLFQEQWGWGRNSET